VACGEAIVVDAPIERVREIWGGALKHLIESETGGV
jgi:hypothetical protein